MDTILGILQASDGDPLPQKKVDLVQIIVVIGSGILSSTTIATVVKAWLDSRKTRLTIQIDGETKKLEYEGLYLSQEVSTIQAILETLGEETHNTESVDAVTIDLTDDGQQEARLLEALDHEKDDSGQAVALSSPSPWKRLLLGWLHR
jgi:galactitol-specific phosphotransferase system IIB component